MKPSNTSEGKERFTRELDSKRDKIENWSIQRLKKEASDDTGADQSKSISRDDIGID